MGGVENLSFDGVLWACNLLNVFFSAKIYGRCYVVKFGSSNVRSLIISSFFEDHLLGKLLYCKKNIHIYFSDKKLLVG